jgi:hypothetical protein
VSTLGGVGSSGIISPTQYSGGGSGGTPSGPAGGALGGTYPNPFIGLSPSGDTTGAKDTANILGLLALANVAYLQLATYYTNVPLLVPAGGLIKGVKGCGPSIYDQAPPTTGTIIKPSSTWIAGASPAAVVVINGLGVHLRDFWVDGTNFWTGGPPGGAPATTADGVWDGITGYNSANLRNVGVYNMTGYGIHQTGTEWTLFQCVTNIVYEDGFHGNWVDGVALDCFAQTCGLNGSGSGYYISGAQTKFIGCRGDLSTNGFFIDAGSNAAYVDMIQLIGCSTQRNNHNGLIVQNDGSTNGRVPVVLSGCVFDGDGINGTIVASGGTPAGSGTITGGVGGGGYASILVKGACTVIIDGLSTTAATRDVAAGCPEYGIATAAVSGYGPNLVSVNTAMINAITAAINDAAPSTLFLTGPNVCEYVGGVYTGIPTATQVKQIIPSSAPYAIPAGFTPANPAPTASTSLVMMGLGTTCVFTPAATGQVMVNISCAWTTATGASIGNIGVRYGTGTAPANGAAVTGTGAGFGGGPANSLQVKGAGIGSNIGLSFPALLTLTPGTAYWFDICTSTQTAADVATVTQVAMTFAEVP